ncbi:MAG: ATPase, T2SS/T4P/T4SS family [Candidatus Altiarchaeota archaeon]|nr:ATPase, T2SS/T4P/T4SS family [Candidatus Altiarchaeota archaeon]
MAERDSYLGEETLKVTALYEQIYDIASKSKKPLPVDKLKESLNIDEYTLAKIIDLFSKARVFEMKEDRIAQVSPPSGLVRYEGMESTRMLEEHTFAWKSLTFQIKILDVDNETVPIYYIPPLKISNGLKIMLKSIFYNLVRVKGEYINPRGTDYDLQTDMSKQLAVNSIQKDMGARPDIADKLADALIFEFSEIGCLHVFLADNDVEEVVFNGENNPVSVYHRRYGWMKSNVYPSGDEALYEIANRMVRHVKKEINYSNPIVETRLKTGERVNTLLNTVSPQGTVVTIRKFSKNPWTIVGLIKEFETTNIDVAALLWFAVEYDLNILVAGGSGSGKTALLNAICNLIPPSIHVISVEIVREIHISGSRAWNWLSLISRDEPNVEKIDTTDLINTSLKMRPDRIILGEAVRAEEIKSLFQVMQVGHPVYSTIHATSSRELLTRIMDPAYNIPRAEINSLDMVIVMHRDIREKTRKISEVSEVIYGPHLAESDMISKIYMYSPKTKSYNELSKPRKIFEKVSVKTGKSVEEMREDIDEKKKVLQWALDNKITEMGDLEVIVEEYYTNRRALLEQIEKNAPPQQPPAGRA